MTNTTLPKRPTSPRRTFGIRPISSTRIRKQTSSARSLSPRKLCLRGHAIRLSLLLSRDSLLKLSRLGLQGLRQIRRSSNGLLSWKETLRLILHQVEEVASSRLQPTQLSRLWLSSQMLAMFLVDSDRVRQRCLDSRGKLHGSGMTTPGLTRV